MADKALSGTHTHTHYTHSHTYTHSQSRHTATLTWHLDTHTYTHTLSWSTRLTSSNRSKWTTTHPLFRKPRNSWLDSLSWETRLRSHLRQQYVMEWVCWDPLSNSKEKLEHQGEQWLPSLSYLHSLVEYSIFFAQNDSGQDQCHLYHQTAAGVHPASPRGSWGIVVRKEDHDGADTTNEAVWECLY